MESTVAEDRRDFDELYAVWRICLSRIRWQRAADEAEASGDQDAAEAARLALLDLPEVSPLQGLRANAEIVSRMMVQRYIAMKVAQEHGATSEEIGRALRVSRQSAWEFMRRKIEEHGGNLPPDDPGGGAPVTETDY